MNVTPFLQFLNYLKVLHWATKSYSHHKVLDEGYSDFGDKIDEFVESFSGLYMIKKFAPVSVSFETSAIDVQHEFKMVFEAMIAAAEEYADGNSELTSLVDDLNNLGNKISYLLAMH